MRGQLQLTVRDSVTKKYNESFRSGLLVQLPLPGTQFLQSAFHVLCAGASGAAPFVCPYIVL